MFRYFFRTFMFIYLFYGCSALYEDQAGKFDWKQSYVGRVKFSHIDNSGKRAFVATENNVVASLNLVDGSLLWRKVLESRDAGVIHAFSVGSEVVTLSGNGPYLLRGWNLKSGFLSYEWSIPGTPGSDYKWTLDSNRLHQVKFLNGALELSSYHIKTGSAVGAVPKSIPAPWYTSSSKCLLDKGIIFCTSRSLAVHAYGLSDSSLTSSIETSPASPSEFHLTNIASPYPTVAISYGEETKVAVLFGDSIISQEVSKCVSLAVKKTATEPIIICAKYNNQEGYELQAYSFGEILTKIAAPREILHHNQLPKGTITSLIDISSDATDNAFLIVGNDDSLILVARDKVQWIREEALANVITAEMVDLPVSDEEAAIEVEFANKEGGIIGMFCRRIHSQVLQATNFLMSILGLKQTSGDSELGLRKDQFGLHKLIILVTKSSKVYGMESDRGSIVWQFYLEDLIPFSSLGKLTVPFFLQRNSRHFALPSVSTLLFKQKGSGQTAVYSFNPITGQPLFGGLTKLNYRVKQSLLLPKEDNEFIKGLIFLSDKNEVSIYPESSKQVAFDLRHSLYIFTVSPENGLLEGYSFISPAPNELGVVKVWNVRLSPPIIDVAIKNKAERVHSQGRVLGDRSVLYKYINPHLIALATYNIDPIHKNLVTIFLIDSVNGAIIFSAVHKRAIPPVYIVHSENWVVYSFFNDKSRRTEIVSLDLYEGKTHRNSTEFSSVNAVPLDPFIERQAYIFPHNVMAMRETITEKGITNKHVLVGVTTGNVLEVPWALLDPHRSPDGREEGVIPYTPDLSLPHEAYLTYNHSLPHISGIHTSPSGLESTSLVLIYGLDLFYTRVAPSKTFDVLKDDFEYWLITLVLGGLISAAYISKKFASRKALRQAWK